MPKFCANCGAKLPDAAKFCASCGTSSNQPVSSTPPSLPATRKFSRPAITIILAALGLFGLTTVLYLAYRDHHEMHRATISDRSGMVTTRFGPLKDATTAYEVKYTPQTVVMSNEAVVSHLRKMSDDGATFDFDSSSDEVRNLKPGSVLLLSGVALRKVTGVVQTGGGIEVRTDPAQLTDAIQDGKIEARYDVNFGSLHSNPVLSSKVRSPFALIPVTYADTVESQILSGVTNFSVTISPFTYKVKFTPAPEKLNIEMSIGVEDAQGVLTVEGKGFLKNFHSTVEMLVQDGQMSDFNLSDSDLGGEMEFSWAASNAVSGPMTKLASWPQEVLKNVLLRNAAFRVPFMVGPIPFTLKFTAGVTFTPAFTSKNGLCKGSVKVSFGGDGGLTVTHGQTSPSGSVSESGQIDPATRILSLGPVGFTVAIEMPRISLDLGLNPFALVPAAYVNVVGSYGTVTYGVVAMPMPAIGALPCQTNTLALAMNAGVSVSTTSAFSSFFGFGPKASMSTALYKKTLKEPGPNGVMCKE